MKFQKRGNKRPLAFFVTRNIYLVFIYRAVTNNHNTIIRKFYFYYLFGFLAICRHDLEVRVNIFV